jgi:hypothetical protein
MAPPFKRPMYATGDPHGMTVGFDVVCAKFAARRYEDGLMPPEPPGGDTKQFGTALKEALQKVIQPQEGIPATGNIGRATWDVLWPLLDDYHRYRYRLWKVPSIPKPNPVPDLGPLYVGGASVLNHSPTHNSDGVPMFLAYDDGWIAGRTVLAVEDMIVDTKHTSSNPGSAFYATGKSKLRYWYAHLTDSPALGREFKKGDAVGRIYNQGSRSHVHLGIDARGLIGRSLLYGANGNGPDYTYGSPTVGAQLREYLSL